MRKILLPLPDMLGHACENDGHIRCAYPLDVLVYTRESLIPGSVESVRPIGVLHMTDDGDADDKIIAVPVSDADPTYDGITTIEDLPKAERNRLEQFFDIYKILQGTEVTTNGYDGVDAAMEIITEAANG